MNLLTKIEEGMEVYDSNGDKVGEVDYVHVGDEDPSRPGAEAATPSPEATRNDTLIDVLAEALRSDSMPEELRERLRLHGFLRVDTGMLRSDRYVMPENIASVADEKVHLNVKKDALAS